VCFKKFKYLTMRALYIDVARSLRRVAGRSVAAAAAAAFG
jgi:hypothetical protein